ncbi:hypothetical protein C0992_002754 [Termitomyces sp. T32_za158]|nr:hypothetical protein C0992_002754 [Termitomyces sp. T32_za158]
MVGADLRHWSSQNSQPRCAAEIPVPKPNFFASEATLPSATYNYTPVGVDVQHAVNAAFQSYGLSNNDMFPASHATQQAREYINQSSDTANPNAVHTLLSKDALQDLLRSIEAMNLPHLSPQAPSVPSEQLRKTLVPMLLKNVQRRPDFNHNLLAEVEVGLRDALTDQFCDSLFRKLVTTRINNREVRATRGSKDDENHPGPLMPGKYMQGLPHINAPEHSDKRDDFVSTSVPNNERATPLAVQGPMVTVKREPDIEDFTIALHPPPLTRPSPAVVPLPCAPSSPSSVFPMSTPSTPLTQVPVAPTHLPPTRVSPGPRSLIDINPTVQVLGHPPDIPEEDRNTSPSFVELGVAIPPSAVSSSSVLPPASVALPVKLSPQQQQPVNSSMFISSKPPSSPSMMTQPLHVPGLWFAKHGQDQADILDCEFEVNSEIVQKWHLPGSSTPEATSERLSLQLLCIPVELLQKTCQIDSIHELVDLGALTGSMSSMKTVWPEQGSLLVQMNPTKPHKRSWFPEDMGPTSPSLDITDSVHEGKNVLRLIQLEDMTNKIFVLQALLLPPTSQQDTPTYWDIADSNLADHLATGDLSPEIVESI